MQYAILIYESEQDRQKRRDSAQWAEQLMAYAAYGQALAQAGVIRGGSGLEAPETASVVSLRGGKTVVQDGPYSDTKEQLGGFFLIETRTLDEALQWAARCPGAVTGKIEVRACLPPPPDSAR